MPANLAAVKTCLSQLHLMNIYSPEVSEGTGDKAGKIEVKFDKYRIYKPASDIPTMKVNGSPQLGNRAQEHSPPISGSWSIKVKLTDQNGDDY